MQWPEPAHTEQSLARLARPTKGGAVRIRIALGTAVAVTAIPAIFFAFSSSSPATSARLSRQEASSQHQGAHMHHAVRINDTLMSYAQAQKAAAMVTYANAVKAAQVKTYLTEFAYLKAVTVQKQQQQQQLQQQQQQAAAQAAATARAAAVAAAASAQAAAAATPAPVASEGGSDATSTNTADWSCIRQHESGGNYAVGNGGAYQFEFGTWNSLTGLPSPAQDYPAAVQDAAALKLYSQRGWAPWTTHYVCGL
jgi:Transglycosylase-like domain